MTDAVEAMASGAIDQCPKRQALLKAAKQRQLGVIVVWKLNCWGRSLVDSLTMLYALTAFDVRCILLTEALDLMTPARGRL